MPLPLDLFGEVITASGTRFRWDANQAAGSRPQNLTFSTKVGEGFSTCQLSLPRRIDLDYPDLNLVDTVRFVGADGSVAWEGRVSALPRQLGDTHSISVTLTGWMAHLKDLKFREVYVDRDLNAWGDLTAGRRSQLLTANWSMVEGGKVAASPTDNLSTVETSFTGGWVSPYKPMSEAFYYADGIPLGRVIANAAPSLAIDTTAVNWFWLIYLSTDDLQTTTTSTANLRTAGLGPHTLISNGPNYVYAMLDQFYNATPIAAEGTTWTVQWSNIAVYGTHGLTTYPGEVGQPAGVLASDVIRNIINRWCPQINTDGVLDTGYVIQHLTFKDRTYPYDALLEINKYHLWQLAVWENKTLHFEPYDLEDYDWEIRTDDPGTTFEPQGPSIDDVFNGIVVSYTDALKGTKNVLVPGVYTQELLSTDPVNPWNTHGVDHYDEIELSTPSTLTQALQLGRAALADRSVSKNPGTITVKGRIRDRAGNLQPTWKVRAGDTIAVTNFPNSIPRLIVETTYDDSSKEVSMSIDRPFALLEAYLDRTATALTARGLA